MSAIKSVAIIGAGPVGLAAAAHALERGLKPIVLEAGESVGKAARQWGHVRMFSPWEYNIDPAAGRLLAQAGWNSPDPQHYPTGSELVEGYLELLATRTALRDHIHTSSRVTAISRVGFDRLKTSGRETAPFEIRYQNGAGPKTVLADAVIDASGTWSSPSPAGANGLEAIGEREAQDHIAYAMPDVLGRDRSRYANKTIAVLGSGHSAVGALIDLVHLKDIAPQTQVIWLLRGDKSEKAFGGGANDKLSARGELGSMFARMVKGGGISVEASFKVRSLALKNGRLVIGSDVAGREIVADDLIVATGFRPDNSFLRELRISLDPALECPPALAPLIDPNEHSCGTVRPHGAQQLAQPEPGFYFAGMKSYGRAPTFLLLTGYEQVRSIVADIAGDREAAERVELVLPETGVCTASVDPASGESAGCCGGAPKSNASACCVADETAKAAGKAGCGCG
ncbi:MAG: NAD(P)-binding domain-containing protein [Xanthobacteraceae bacterium]|nr:NAD(P)-binding domain-containing protein [Xanthobacteraceae bacterium]